MQGIKIAAVVGYLKSLKTPQMEASDSCKGLKSMRKNDDSSIYLIGISLYLLLICLKVSIRKYQFSPTRHRFSFSSRAHRRSATF
jgi:hypothetical protein